MKVQIYHFKSESEGLIKLPLADFHFKIFFMILNSVLALS